MKIIVCFKKCKSKSNGRRVILHLFEEQSIFVGYVLLLLEFIRERTFLLTVHTRVNVMF